MGWCCIIFSRFCRSFIFPIPPDVLLIALCLDLKTKAFKFAFICSAGSALGARFGYSIGEYLWWTPTSVFSALAIFSLI